VYIRFGFVAGALRTSTVHDKLARRGLFLYAALEFEPAGTLSQ
jgi:hypothetical protein